VPRSIYNQIPEQAYQQIHVTLLSTTSPHPNPAYFGFSEGVNMPRVLLTTKNSAAQPEFNSLSYHGLIREGEWAVKIISDQKITNEWLDNMFNGQVKWLLRKQVSLFSLLAFAGVRI
jgi:prenylcysteine oxidase/farnesylcysteine lyase